MKHKSGQLVAGWRNGKIIIGYIEREAQENISYYKICWMPPNDELDGLYPTEQVKELKKIFEEQFGPNW